jgi:putative copper export protein/mono/diheme cytochrome c family protein
MDATDLALSVVRGANIAASFSIFGVPVFWSVVAPLPLMQADAATRRQVGGRFFALFQASLAVVFVTATLWLLIEASVMADAASLVQSLTAIWPVVTDTRFGHVMVLRLALLGFACVSLGDGTKRRRVAAAAFVAGLALSLHAWLAHAGASADTGGRILLVNETLHLLAGGAWLGSLTPLVIMLSVLNPNLAFLTARRFAFLGLLCVTALAGTAIVQSWMLIGSLGGLFGTDYGHVALLKLGLFLTLLAIADTNQFRFTPALSRPAAEDTKRRFVRSVAVETAIGVSVVLAAAFLAELTPATHEQAVWPFAWRPNPDVLDNRDLSCVAIVGLIGFGAMILLLGLGLIWRGLLPLFLILAAIDAIWTLPDLGRLLIPSYPTSFYRSPTGFAAQSIVRGAELFPDHCAACHGMEGRGDGPQAKSLPVPPADLTAPHLWGHSDGDLYWWLTHGIEGPHGDLVMPGFSDTLSEEDRWALIDYMHAHNGGMAISATGKWPQALPAPDFYANCPGGRVRSLIDLNAKVVRIAVLDPSNVSPPLALPLRIATQVTSVWLTRDPHLQPSSVACVDDGRSTWNAYAIVSGVAPNKLAGSQFLIDPKGYLRARWRPGDLPDWTEPDAFLAKIEEIRSHPVATYVRPVHVHSQ